MKAFSYLRVSGLAQLQGDGIERQRQAVVKYSTERQMDVVREFRDEGISGAAEAMDRPALTDMLISLDGQADVKLVLVERSDRVARDLLVGELILSKFRELGVLVIEVEGGTELTVMDGEPTKVLIRQILGAIAQFEKATIVRKLNAARARMRARGERAEGPKPFGERDGEQPVVERIRELHGRNMTIAEISDHLNADFTPTRKKDCRWHPTMVGRILRRSA